MPAAYVMAIDQGTTGTTVLILDKRLAIRAKVNVEFRQIFPKPGWVEHDLEEIWTCTLAVIRRALREAGVDGKDVAAIGITNQRETTALWDRRTGRPLHHAIVWQDRRGDPICRALREQGREKFVLEKTGLKIDTYFSASKLKWLIREKPDLAAKLKTGEAVIGTIDAYLLHRLTGGNVFATDSTNASRTLLFDIGKLRWDDKLCALLDVPIRALPEVRESAAHFGETDVGGVLPKRVPIIGVMGDSQASLFAQRCYQPGMAKATFGTGTTALSGWKVGWTFGGNQTISNAWNATVTQSGSAVTARSAAYNGSVPAGGSTTFGFVANGSVPSSTALSCG